MDFKYMTISMASGIASGVSIVYVHWLLSSTFAMDTGTNVRTEKTCNAHVSTLLGVQGKVKGKKHLDL